MGSKFSKVSIKFKNSNSSKNLSSPSPSISSDNTITTLATLASSSSETFRFENGRRYVGDNTFRYLLPNDDEEIDRLQLQHYLLRYVWQNNFSSPVNEILLSGADVLDVGCGPGTWILEMATEYPQSRFIGIDIAPIFPSEIKPFNATFQKLDVTYRLPYDDDTFDFIHIRLMFVALRENDWKETVFPELFRILKPGGYIESHEFDFNIVNSGPNMTCLVNGFAQYFKGENVNIFVCPLIPGFLQEANFININVINQSAKYGSWDGRFGKFAIDDFLMLFQAVKYKLCLVMKIEEDEYTDILSKLEEEVNEHQTSYKVY
ncbi:16122_t:CDS:2, partial [Funneliformis geosporum]